VKGCVYFIGSAPSGRIKIGWAATNPLGRLATLQAGSAEELSPIGHIEGDRKLEAEIHRKFDHLRLHGEWFDGAAELRDYIEVNAVEGLYGDRRQTRNTARIILSLFPSELAEFRQISERLAAPGKRPNLSGTVSRILRFWLEAEGRGETPHDELPGRKVPTTPRTPKGR
jgi:T5orf172 domain